MNSGAGAIMNVSRPYAYTESSEYSDVKRAEYNVMMYEKEFRKAKERRDRNDPKNMYALSQYKRALNNYVDTLSTLVSVSKGSMYVTPEEYNKVDSLYKEYKAYKERVNTKMAKNTNAYANDPYKFVYPNAENASQTKGGRRSRKTCRVRRKNRKSRRV